jgi:hypothetical protein
MAEKDPNKIERIPKGVSPSRELITLAAKHEPATGPLTLIHVTSAGNALRILEANQLVTRDCEIFKKPLVYLFLCHAAYRRNRWDEKSSKLFNFPAAVILDPAKLGQPFHVYPFDTGAAVSGIYQDAQQDGVYLEEYALSNDVDGARRFITWAFGSLDRYLKRELKTTPELLDPLDPWNARADQFSKIARQAAKGNNKNPDQRAATIEFAYDQNVPLKDIVRCIIVPDALLENPRTKTQNLDLLGFAKICGAEIKPYKWSSNDAPNWHMDQIEKLCHEELRSEE